MARRIKLLIWDDEIKENDDSKILDIIEYFDGHYKNMDIVPESLDKNDIYKNDYIVSLDYSNRLNFNSEDHFNFFSSMAGFHNRNKLQENIDDRKKNVDRWTMTEFERFTDVEGGSLDKILMNNYDIILSDMVWKDQKNWSIGGVYNYLYAYLFTDPPPVVRLITQFSNEINMPSDDGIPQYKTDHFGEEAYYIAKMLQGMCEKMGNTKIENTFLQQQHKSYLAAFENALKEFQEKEIFSMQPHKLSALYHSINDVDPEIYRGNILATKYQKLKDEQIGEFTIETLFPDIYSSWKNNRNFQDEYKSWYKIWSQFILKKINLSISLSSLAFLADPWTHPEKYTALPTQGDIDIISNYINELKLHLRERFPAEELIQLINNTSNSSPAYRASEFKKMIRISVLQDADLANSLDTFISGYKDSLNNEDDEKDVLKYLYCLPAEICSGMQFFCNMITCRPDKENTSPKKPVIKVSAELLNGHYVIKFAIHNTELNLPADLSYLINPKLSRGFGNSFILTQQAEMLKEYAIAMTISAVNQQNSAYSYDYFTGKKNNIDMFEKNGLERNGVLIVLSFDNVYISHPQ